MCPSFRRFQTVFHNSSIFLPYWLATLVSFRETFQEEKLLTMKGSYKSRWVIVIVVVIAAIAAFWFWQGRNDSRSAAPGATKQAQQSPASGRRGMRSGPLAPVQAATAVEQAVPRYLTGLGTITAANTVTVRSRVDGQLMALHFQEGQQVKAGDLLAEIDPSQFKVALAQAQGQLAKDKATLANARRDLARYQQLAKTNLVSRQELDAQQALVSETEGTIKLSVPEKLNSRKKYGIPENSFVVMGCGQTQTRKGVRDFLAVAEDNPDMTFVWVGGFTFGKITEGYKSLKKMISNPPPNVKFLGIIPNEEMNSIYNCADILFMPSYDELFPMTILEASNVNIPILVRDLPLYNPVLFDKVLRGNNNLEFSSILKELVKNPIKRAEAIIKSTELAEMYTADKVYSQWDELIDKLIDDGKEKKRD